MISYKDIALQIFSYSSQADYNCYRVIAHFVPNFVVMATGVGWGKCDWQHSMAHPRKPSYRRKNFADISYTSRVIAYSYSLFCPKFRCHGNQGGSGVKVNDTIRLAIPENHTSVSYTHLTLPTKRIV